MSPIRVLRASAVCICLTMVAAHAQTPQSRMFERLHAALDLTPAQEKSWMTFEQVYAIDPQVMAKRRDALATMPTLTAPQRIDLSINLMRADLESLRQRSAALKTFYNTLSPQQRGIFDRETLPRQRGYD
jgi:hypothetical protein